MLLFLLTVIPILQLANILLAMRVLWQLEGLERQMKENNVTLSEFSDHINALTTSTEAAFDKLTSDIEALKAKGDADLSAPAALVDQFAQLITGKIAAIEALVAPAPSA